MTYKQAVKEYSKLLRNITHIPQKEVEILLLHILQKNVIWLHLHFNEQCSCQSELESLVKKRATSYPLEYITNKATFFGEVFMVEPGVLIPRPETEILVEKTQNYLEEFLKKKNVANIVEIGTGSGIISIMLALLVDNIKITAVDINKKALALAKSNALKHGVEDKIEFIESDLFATVSSDQKFDICVSNPPYIADDYKLPKNVKFEPLNALVGGDQGDELLKKIINECYEKNIHYLACEMGYDQKIPLTEYIENRFEFKSLVFYQDYEKFDRGFELQF